jgi:hypothetical protein
MVLGDCARAFPAAELKESKFKPSESALEHIDDHLFDPFSDTYLILSDKQPKINHLATASATASEV